MALGNTGTDFRVPLRAKLLQSGSTNGGLYKYVNLFDSSGNVIAAVPNQNALTALAGGGQSGATALVAGVNRITVCASLHDSCILPASTPGTMVFVKNAGAQSADIYGLGNDVINAVAALSPYTPLATTKAIVFFCSVAGQWDTILTA